MSWYKVPKFNSLWLSDTIWWYRSWSTLAQITACCLAAPSHYLNQCWLIVSTDQWHLSKGNITRDAPAINHENQLQFASIEFLWNLPRVNELSHILIRSGHGKNCTVVGIMTTNISEKSFHKATCNEKLTIIFAVGLMWLDAAVVYIVNEE